MRVNLSVDEMQLALDPCAGGAVQSFKHRDLDILRPGPIRTGPAFDPIEYAAFPMVPFVGRIHQGAFTAGSKAVQLHRNFPPEPHAIHGHGWQSSWRVERQTDAQATLKYAHSADAWPWAYTARQDVHLTKDQLRVQLSVTNDSDSIMPAGLGWHPYFPREGAELRVPTTHEWFPDETTGDNRPKPIAPTADLTTMQRVSDLNLDTTFSVADGVIEMHWPTHSVTMTSDENLRHATIYVPPGQRFFCAEPVSHAPNAVNSALASEVTGFQTLEPGQTLSGGITLNVNH